VIGGALAAAALLTRVLWRRAEAQGAKRALRLEIFEQARTRELRGPTLRHKAQGADLARRDVQFVVEYRRKQIKLLNYGCGASSEQDEAESERLKQEFKRILLGN